MMTRTRKKGPPICWIILVAALAAACNTVNSSSETTSINTPDTEESVESELPGETQGNSTAVFAGGCFWGVEAVFEHIRGVKDVRSGYAGGDARSAKYDLVSEGKTEHAESVKVNFDPKQVSYSKLLEIFFSVAHNPTQLNQQGPDIGRQYRSAIFYVDESQRAVATAHIEELTRSGAYPQPIVTEIVPLQKFYNAESYHQDFMRKNPDVPYIVQHDRPKLEDLKKRFPDVFIAKYFR